VKTELSESSSLKRGNLVHIAIAGAIGFGITVLLFAMVPDGFMQLLFNLNMGGIIFFIDLYQVARNLFIFGLVYLTGGFCSGIYAGYNVYPNLKKTLFIPAVINTVGFLLLVTLIDNYPVTMGLVYLLLIQLTGNTIGSYLGGYAINWGELHKETETPEKLSLKTRK